METITRKISYKKMKNLKKIHGFKVSNRVLTFTLIILIVSINFLSINCFCFTANSSIEVREEINYTCNGYESYKEICVRGFWIEVKELEEAKHNITIIIKTNETLKNIAPHWVQNVTVKNQTIFDGYIITTVFSGNQIAIYLYFSEVKEKTVDPFDLYFLSPLKPFCIDEYGFLRFALLLHAFEPINQTYFYFKTFPTSLIKDSFLICDDLEFKKLYEGIFVTPNVSIGKHILNFKASVNAFKGIFNEICAGTTIDNKLTKQLTIFIDGKEVSYQKKINIEYSIVNVEFIKSNTPGIYYYDNYKYYVLNFLSDKTFRITIDNSGREQIDFLTFNSTIRDFKVNKLERYGNTCFEIIFDLDSITNVSLGLIVYDKNWFAPQYNITLQKIPYEILKMYEKPYELPDWNYIDVENPLVKEWAKQVSQKGTTPYEIARYLYENLSNTLNYSEAYSSIKNSQDELASSTLKRKSGVCRHFARAYTALCIASGIPSRTVYGTVYVGNETYKKNHEWSEVYLPYFGWITVDVTLKENGFGTLPSSHIVYTLWTYINGTLNITTINKNEVKTSNHLLYTLIIICDKKIADINNLIFSQFLKDEIEKAMLLLENAKALTQYNQTYKALIYIANAFLIINKIENKITFIFTTIIILLLLIAGIIVLAKLGIIMRKKFLLKILGKIFLLMIIPILLIIKLGWESILPIIIYLQLLLIWAQAEIAMRQTVLTSVQFEPLFDIRETPSQMITRDSQSIKIFSTYIRNISEYPAYNLGIGRILDKQKQPIDPSLWPKFLRRNNISCLSPNQEFELYTIDPSEREKILENELTFEILYFNRFGEVRTFYIIFSKMHPPLLMHEEIRKPGFLLNTFEDITFLLRFYKFQKWFREKLKR